MFEPENRFVTESVQEMLEETLIQAMFDMIDDRRNETYPPLDHIQLFSLYVMIRETNQVQVIIHQQEREPWERAYILPNIEHPLHLKCFWCVDDGESSVLSPYHIDLHDYYRSIRSTGGGIGV